MALSLTLPSSNLKLPIKSLREAMKLVEQLSHFAQFHVHQEFALSLAKSNDLIYTLKLEVPKQQRTLQDFLSNILSDTGIVIFAICIILHVAIKM